MIRLRTCNFLLGAFVAIGPLPATLHAQTGDQVQARSRPLIVVDGVVLQGGTATERESVLRIIQPAIESIEVLKGAAAVQRFGEAAADGVIVIRLKSDFARTQPGAGAARDVVISTAPLDAQSSAPLVIVDGVIVPRTVMGGLKPEDIDKIEVIKGAAAVELFGEAGRAGVIQITTKKRELH